MNEEHGTIRFVPFVVLGVLATLIIAFMIYLCRPNDNGGLSTLLGDTTSTTQETTLNATNDTTTTRSEMVTNDNGEVVTQIITEPTRATTAATRATLPDEYTYKTAFDFDGWQVEFKDGVYDRSAQTLTFTVTELTTRKRAKPISYFLAIDETAVEYTTAVLPAPEIDPIYYELDALVNQAHQVAIYDVPPDFEYIKINLQTYSIADDATNGAGVIVSDTRYIAAYQLTTL